MADSLARGAASRVQVVKELAKYLEDFPAMAEGTPYEEMVKMLAETVSKGKRVCIVSALLRPRLCTLPAPRALFRLRFRSTPLRKQYGASWAST